MTGCEEPDEDMSNAGSSAADSSFSSIPSSISSSSANSTCTYSDKELAHRSLSSTSSLASNNPPDVVRIRHRHRHPHDTVNSKWDRHPRTLKELLARHSPPFVVRLSKGNIEKYLPVCSFGRATDVTFKVLEKRWRKVILVRKMHWERQIDDYMSVGPQLEIPAEFKGWFEILPEDGRPVEYYDSIHGITSVKPRRFLVRTSTVGYQLVVDDVGSSWQPCEIRAGEVLTTGIVYMDQKQRSKSPAPTMSAAQNSSGSGVSGLRNLLRKFLKSGKLLGKGEQDLRYLQCFDDHGREIMIPLIMSGVFSPIGDATETNYDAVYDLNDMLLAFPLPVNTQLVRSDASIHQDPVVPKGVIKIEGSKEEERVVVCLNNGNDDCEEKFEMPLINDLLVQKQCCDVTNQRSIYLESESRDRNVHNNVKHISDAKHDNSNNSNIDREEIVLPSKSKEKKFRASSLGILGKLSQRSSKKDRANLRAMQEEGIFSSKMNKIETDYDKMSHNLEDQMQSTQMSEDGPVPKPPPRTKGILKKHSFSAADLKQFLRSSDCSEIDASSRPLIAPKPGNYAVVCKLNDNHGLVDGETSNSQESVKDRISKVQDRTLPPIPNEKQFSSVRPSHIDLDDSTETLYEHLPSAPGTPTSPSAVHVDVRGELGDDHDDDGYLVPAKAKYEQDQSVLYDLTYEETNARWRSGKQTAHAKIARTQKARSTACDTTDRALFEGYDRMQFDVDVLLDDLDSQIADVDLHSCYYDSEQRFTENNGDHQRYTSCGYVRSASRDLGVYAPSKGRYTKASNALKSTDPNASLRNNMSAKRRSAMELFHFNNSVKNVETSSATCLSPLSDSYLLEMDRTLSPQRTPQPFQHICKSETADDNDDIICPHLLGQFQRGHGTGRHYASSEPGYRQMSRSWSAAGLSDTYIKNGDDSAISMCSRGEYGFQVGSDYSYSEHNFKETVDDQWVPPDDSSQLTVLEVSKSLRYIGMKDRVVLRFSQEQIDGSMLCSLDKKLLQEGFPELNALEIKKILDYVGGWRPKK